MKRSTVSILALAMLTIIVSLTGCTDKHIAEVKALPFSYPDDNTPDPNLTVDQALDYRKICKSTRWKVKETEQHQTFVEYRCMYKGYTPNAAVMKDAAAHPGYGYSNGAGDVYQWTYGPDGKPTLTYVAMRLYASNGNDRDYGRTAITELMELAAKNTVTSYDDMLRVSNNGEDFQRN